MAPLKQKTARQSPPPGRKHRTGEVRLQRVYNPLPADGSALFLVDRLWPRGIKKDALSNAQWLPEVAPSPELRHWFGHEPAKWNEFRKRYRAELANNPAGWRALAQAVAAGDVTLLFGAKDLAHNQAVVLKEFLEEKSV